MGSTNGKLKLKPKTSASNASYDKQLQIVAFAYVRPFQRAHGAKWPIDILKSSIIYLIIAYVPRRFAIYGIGENKFGELGVGHCTVLSKFQKLDAMSALLQHTNNIYRGYGRFMIQSIDGALHCCGNNYRGDVGADMYQLSVHEFVPITHDSNHWFACDIVGDGIISNHTIVVSNHPHANLYAFGSNRRGQFGNYYSDAFSESNYVPVPILSSEQHHRTLFLHERIIKIQCGEYHTLFLTSGGHVFAAGDNLYGQCGIHESDAAQQLQQAAQRPKKAYLPVTLVKDLRHIIDIASGAYHNLCLNAAHELFVFGDNPNGQCGTRLFHERANRDRDLNDPHNYVAEGGAFDINLNDENILYRPIKCEFFATRNLKINAIETGNVHSCVIDSEARCWLFGEHKYGQLGTGTNFENAISTPQMFSIHGREESEALMEQISCGYQHTAVLTLLNEIFVFGNNESNQCSSMCQLQRINVPWLLTRYEIGIEEDCRVEKVFAGSDTTLVIVKN